MNLEEIQDPSFLKHYTNKQLEQLATDIRQFLIEKLSVNGGHIGPNLGVVELTSYFTNCLIHRGISFCGM